MKAKGFVVGATADEDGWTVFVSDNGKSATLKIKIKRGNVVVVKRFDSYIDDRVVNAPVDSVGSVTVQAVDDRKGEYLLFSGDDPRGISVTEILLVNQEAEIEVR